MTEQLQEYANSQGIPLRVDRSAGVLLGVKLIGLKSRNGRQYRASALRQAVSLYEQAKVNVNHPKQGALAPRDYQDRLGTIRQVQFRPGDGLFGNLHFNPKHALAEQLLWDAEHNPGNVGFSHNVQARVTRTEQGSVVEEITHVHSVDLVADPAATEGLFEQADDTASDATDSESNSELRWDALTRDTLRLHRPDLLAEIEDSVRSQSDSVHEAMQARIATLERSQKIAELLDRYGLPVPVRLGATESTCTAQGVINPAFIETLMTLPDEADVERHVAERAELVRQAASWGPRFVPSGSPRSREQHSIDHLAGPQFSAGDRGAELARSLKTL